jgi:hypothetical protein
MSARLHNIIYQKTGLFIATTYLNLKPHRILELGCDAMYLGR